MNQLCRLCRSVNSSANSYCSQCGALLRAPHPPDSQGPPRSANWKGPAALSALAASVFWICVLALSTADRPRVQSLTSTADQPQAAAPAATPAAAATPLSTAALALTAGQHLSEARRALAESEKPAASFDRPAGLIAAARWHAEAITAKEREYAEARKLLIVLVQRERAVGAAAAEATAAASKAAAQPAAVADPEADGPSSPESRTQSEDAGTAGAASATRARVTTGDTAAAGRDSPSSISSGGGGYYTNRAGNKVRSPTFSDSAPSGATARCRDGSYSFSQSRRGTCSHHGGVAAWL